jgi:hypothetical protein
MGRGYPKGEAVQKGWAVLLAMSLHLLVAAWWEQAALRLPMGERRSHSAQAVPWQVRWAMDRAPMNGNPAAASVGDQPAQPSPGKRQAPPQPTEPPPAQHMEDAAALEPTVPPHPNPIATGGLAPHEPQGHTGHATADLPPGPPRPVLPTRVPASFEQALQVRRGAQRGQARWAWEVDRGRYRSRLTADVKDRAGTAALDWASHGGIDEHGVSPDRFLSRPVRGGARAVNFQRDGGVVSYSGPTGQVPLVVGAQDRLSWMVQVLAIVQARVDGPLAAADASKELPSRLPIWVAGPQGDGGDWWFEVHRRPDTGCWHFRRQAERRYDVQVDLWVAGPPAASGARLARLVMGPDGGRQAAWELRDSDLALACGLPP